MPSRSCGCATRPPRTCYHHGFPQAGCAMWHRHTHTALARGFHHQLRAPDLTQQRRAPPRQYANSNGAQTAAADRRGHVHLHTKRERRRQEEGPSRRSWQHGSESLRHIDPSTPVVTYGTGRSRLPRTIRLASLECAAQGAGLGSNSLSHIMEEWPYTCPYAQYTIAGGLLTLDEGLPGHVVSYGLGVLPMSFPVQSAAIEKRAWHLECPRIMARGY
jgi:hypothetical protein